MALQIHPPRIIYSLLFGLGLICSLLAGFRMSSGQHRSWLHILGFTVLTTDDNLQSALNQHVKVIRWIALREEYVAP